MENCKIPRSFFQQDDVVSLSRTLLGKYLLSKIGPEKVITGGMIIETEAYYGIIDKASHAYNNRRTQRTEVMYGLGGLSYVYLCYGMHHLFNIVTNREEIPHAILIRAIKPEIGIETMIRRRKKKQMIPTLTSGPGSVCQALGIAREHSGYPLDEDLIWLEDRDIVIPPESIEATPRIGVGYAEEDAEKPWRFTIKQ